jgi:hypothetical protein
MIIYLIILILILICGYFGIRIIVKAIGIDRKDGGRYWTPEACWWMALGLALTAISLVFFILITVNIIAFNVGAQNDALNITRMEKTLQLYTDQRQQLIDFVDKELSVYPDYERGVLTQITDKTQFIFNFPNLKDADVLQSKVAQIVEFNKQIQARVFAIADARVTLYNDLHNFFNPVIPGLVSVPS